MSYIYNHIIPDYNKITDRIFLGNLAAAQKKDTYSTNNIKYVINLSNETYTKQPNVMYLDIPIDDSSTANIKQYFEPAVKFIKNGLLSDGNIYIHCRAGISRSTTIVLAYLINMGMTMKDSLNYVASKRFIINPNSGFWEQLREYEMKMQLKNTVNSKRNYFI